MEFRILGPLEVEDDGRQLDLGRPKQRALLALLLVSANAVVSADRLVEELWAGRPPEDASAALQVQVSRLRRALGGPGVVESRRPGYVLHVDPGHLDAARFESWAGEARALLARGAAEPARALLERALALWRGPALAEFADQPFALPEAARLEELRLVAEEERVEAELALGHHAAVVGPLRQLAEAHPLRERLWGQLMVALYRSGRQAEALRAYTELRTNLGEELGIDPSPALAHLEEAVLLQAAELDWSPGPAAEPVAGTTPLPVDLPGPASPFVGRGAQVDEVLEDWRLACGADAGGPRLVLVAGEPGVGKTRLAVEVARAVHAGGGRVLVGHCDEELAVPYQPFAEALARVLPELPPDELEACLGGRGGELVRLVPELADVAPGLPEPVASDPETDRYRLFEAVTRTLAALSRTAPVLLVLDDLQWAARPTLLLVRHLVARGGAMPLLAVGTYRDTERPGDGAPVDLAAELGRPGMVRRIALKGLDEASVAELVSAGAGGAGGRGAGDALVRSIHEGTGGNPLFVGEVVRSLAEQGGPAGHWSPEEAGVPEGVRGVVQRRLARLSDRSRRLLGVASVIGGHYHVSVLEAAAEVDDHEALLAGLEEAMAAGLVAEAPGSSVRQRFTHALVRAALYDGISAARRADLHRRVGEALEAVFAGRLDEHLPELAHHFSEAAEAGAVDKAVDYSTRAGDRALQLLAHDEASRHYARALDLLAGAGAASVREVDLLLALGEAQKRSGDPAHRRTLLDAARLAGALGEGERLARAAVANSRGFWSATNSVDDERVSALEAALDALPPADGPLRACVLANLGVELVYTGDTAGVRRRSDEALAIARRLGDLPTLAGVLIPRYNTIRGDPGTLPERLGDTAELLAVAEALPDPGLRCQAWGWRAIAAMEAADPAEAERCFEVFERLSSELRQPTTLWYATYLRAGRMLLAGRFDEAERLSAEAFDLGRAAGHADAELFRSCQRIQLAFERGGLERWERPLRVALARHPESRWFLRSWQALAYTECDRVDEARAVFDDLAAKDFADLAFEPTWLHVVANCAAVCAFMADTDRANVLYALLLPYDGQFVTMSSLAYSGAVAHYLGLLAAVVGRHGAAGGHFAAAASTEEAMGAPTWLARTRLEWGRSLLGRDRPAATSLLEQARAAAADLGLATVERRAAALASAG